MTNVFINNEWPPSITGGGHFAVCYLANVSQAGKRSVRYVCEDQEEWDLFMIRQGLVAGSAGEMQPAKEVIFFLAFDIIIQPKGMDVVRAALLNFIWYDFFSKRQILGMEDGKI